MHNVHNHIAYVLLKFNEPYKITVFGTVYQPELVLTRYCERVFGKFCLTILMRSLMNLSASIENGLIRHCSPTLACLKTANLFAVECNCTEELDDIIQKWNGRLSGKGLTIIRLSEKNDRSLIYVFREDKCFSAKQRLSRNGRRLGDIHSSHSSKRA